MLIRKKPLETVPRESAHAWSGARRMYADIGEIENPDWRAMTYGYLPGGASFDWHVHEGIDELMLVIKGSGLVKDRDGSYPYAPGDCFTFPANTAHSIENPTDEEHEYVFVRVATRKVES